MTRMSDHIQELVYVFVSYMEDTPIKYSEHVWCVLSQSDLKAASVL